MKIGTFNKLVVSRKTANGLYLKDEETDSEVLLPNKYVTDDMETGAPIDVFVYTDSEDRIVATTQTPKLAVGEIASLQVVDISKYGAFMDWGLTKDLFVPFCNQQVRMQKGEYYPVTAYEDKVTGRVVGTSKISYLVSNSDISVSLYDKVKIIIARKVDRGFRVIVNSKHWGMLYDNQIFSDVSLGNVYDAWVTKITEDKRIDVSLSQPGYNGVLAASEVLLSLLRENGGELPYGDRTDSDVIQANTGLSKKIFKKAVGVLLRENKVEVSDLKIVLK